MKVNCIKNYQNRSINFGQNKTYALLGASTLPKQQEGNEEILKYMQIASDFTKHLVEQNDSVLTGCGNSAIMGSIYYSAYENGGIAQNKVIIKLPEWGDEDKEHCEILGYATTEAERASRFKEISDGIFVFPGSLGTIKETSQLIFENYYMGDRKPIVLVGKEFFKGIDEQYQHLFKNGYLNNIESLDELYTIVDSLEELKGLELE